MSRAIAYYAAQRVKQGHSSEVRAVRPPAGSSAVDGPARSQRRLSRLFSGGVTSAASTQGMLQSG
jgi:hypothetical protein